jgi:hypothetical protein
MSQIAQNREDGGKLVRAAWVRWAEKQPNPKASWLAPWEELSEPDKEADRCIWDEIVAPYAEGIADLRDENQQLREDKNYLLDKVYYLQGGE